MKHPKSRRATSERFILCGSGAGIGVSLVPFFAIEMSRLAELFDSEIPGGRKELQDSHANLLDVASYCEDNYLKAANKTNALAETRQYATQALASVAYQINTLATSMLQMLDLQGVQLADMESSINHIARNVSIHKEKVARREIGVLTTNKNCPRTHKIIAPANPEKPMKYKSTPIDYNVLDDTGHGMKLSNAPKASRTQDIGKQRTDSISSSTSTMSSQDNNFPIYQPMPGAKFGSWGRTSRRPSVPPNAPVAPSTYSVIGREQGVAQGSPQLGRQQQQRPPSLAFGQAPPPPSQIGMAPMGAPPAPPAPPPETEAPNQGHRMSVPPMAPPPIMAPPPMAPPPPTIPAADLGPRRGGPGGDGGGMMMMPPPPPPDMMELPGIMPPPPPPDATMELSSLPPPPPMDNTPYPANMGITDEEMPPPPEFVQAGDMDQSAPTDYMEKVIAIYEYQATRDDELTFQEDDIIYVLKKNPDGWFEGVLHGITGLFPGNYVEVVP
ncbi:abl interactor 2-like [Acanthaster planci]|uniref:Abl interactor 2-like n=1 Tax=Acanthaster planci TaxID=133434 RepID=A0A8B7ZWM0_ACAPL|nr:abl interactor 2-like [Acanthaster planci]